MRSPFVAWFAVLTACSQQPGVNLAVVEGAAPLDSRARHALVVHAGGQASIDGTEYSTDKELRDALERLSESMESEIDPRAGHRLATEPLEVWFDRSMGFEAIERWLIDLPHRAGIPHLRLVVRESSGELGSLTYDAKPSFGIVDGPLHERRSLAEGELVPGRARVTCLLGTLSAKPAQESTPLSPTRFQVDVALPKWSYATLDFGRWQETADSMNRLRGYDTELDVYAYLDPRSTWSDLAKAIHAAIELRVNEFGLARPLDERQHADRESDER